MTMSENLTRAEAQQRSALISVDSYEVVLDLTIEADTFRSTTTVRFGCVEPGASTWIDLIAPNVRSLQLNGQELDIATVVDGPGSCSTGWKPRTSSSSMPTPRS